MATILKKAAQVVFACALLVSPAFAQHDPATVLETNTDLQNEKIFVRIAFDGLSCRTYDLRFRLQTTKGNLGYQKVKVLNGPVWDSKITTEPAEWIARLKNGDSVMYAMKVSGYELEFPLPQGLTVEDSASICIEAMVFSQRCERCGIGGTDMIFTPNDIDPSCPYLNKGNDVLACYKRDSKAGNWEGWILDERDCKPYRIVQMPDGKWWFAQNLNYYGTSTKPLDKKQSAGDPSGTSGTSADYLHTYWCPPAGNSGNGNPGTPGFLYSFGANGNQLPNSGVGVDEACNTYGALYPWLTVMSLDGYATAIADAAVLPAAPINSESTRRGICPKGWFVPSSYDWGKMINLVEAGCGGGCPASGLNATSATNLNLISPCAHNYTSAGTLYWAASKCAFRDLLSTDVAPARELDGTITNYGVGAGTGATPSVKPSLSYSSAPSANTSNLNAPATIITHASATNSSWNYFLPETAGTDKYGFAAKPAGMRHYNSVGNTAKANFYYMGEFAGFWTSSVTSGVANSATNNELAYARGFRYNYRHNADFNFAIQSWTWDKWTGMSVRCVADQRP
ncbi:MAG: fibrobacter succinogenes major paralogous domain-containing protein [Prevotellaceae bacterium]|nr:fibrobacter succinogenes major paralogous domain-containing protein [Prevotellaceae bacterium]